MKIIFKFVVEDASYTIKYNENFFFLHFKLVNTFFVTYDNPQLLFLTLLNA